MKKLDVNLSTFEKTFPTEDIARVYLERRRFGEPVTCPVCKSRRIQRRLVGKHAANQQRWVLRCDEGHEFSFARGTLFEQTKIPIRTWLKAVLVFEDAHLCIEEAAAELQVSEPAASMLRDAIAPAMTAGRERRPRANKHVETFIAYVLGSGASALENGSPARKRPVAVAMPSLDDRAEAFERALVKSFDDLIRELRGMARPH